MVILLRLQHGKVVAPFAGAWIEIFLPPPLLVVTLSLRSSERGLK